MYTQEAAEIVLFELSHGKSLRKAAEAAGVSHSHVLDWCEAVPEFRDQYMRTRARAYEMLADEIIEISDEVEITTKMEGEDVRIGLDATAVARNRLRVDTRKWMLAKMLPKKYGDKVDLTGSLDLNAKVERVIRKVVDPKVNDGS